MKLLAEKFDEVAEVAEHSGATSLEVLVAAVLYTLAAAEFIPNPKQRAAMLDALIGVSLQ